MNDEIRPTIEGTKLPESIAISTGQASLIQGRLLSEDELQSATPVGLISRQLAEINNLEPGSVLTLEYRPTHLIFETDETIQFQVEVVGIIDYHREYRPTKLGSFNQSEALIIENFYTSIVIPNPAVESLYQKGYDLLIQEDYPEGLPPPQKDDSPTSVYFILHDPEDMTAFIEENKVYLPDGYDLYHNQGELYQRLITPLNQLDDLSMKAYVLIISASFVVIFLIILLFLRDRKHELAVLVSMGERKTVVGAQILLETMLIALVSLSLSILIALPLSSYVSQRFLSQSVNDSSLEMILLELEEDYQLEGVL